MEEVNVGGLGELLDLLMTNVFVHCSLKPHLFAILTAQEEE
jgi:hypothetical protein